MAPKVPPFVPSYAPVVRTKGSPKSSKALRVATSLPPSSFDHAGQATILIVDDDHLSAQTIALLVEKIGHRTFRATTWTKAIELFTQKDIDLVLMDALMPSVDGFKLTKMLRQRSTSYVPVVFLTALTDSTNRRMGIECGGDDYLTKPVDELDLKIRLMAMLRIRRLTRTLEVRTERLAQLAHVDNLTGLLNRRSLDKHLGDEVQQAIMSGEPLSVLMIDLDHFKAVNDVHGHDIGDRVLGNLSQVLDETIRTTDLAFRYGGEEFVVLCPGTTLDCATELAERVRINFAERTSSTSLAGRQTMSVGVSAIDRLDLPRTARSEEFERGLLRAADEAVYDAKRRGRDCVCAFSGPQADR